MSAVRVRFAPSPTGILHLGGLRTALINYLFARKHDGRFILRIEDTDQKRFQPNALESILATLKWAKIQPDEGPGFGGNSGPYIQSQRLPLYKDMVNKLLAEKSAYHCFCSTTRLEMLAKSQRRLGETPGYDKKCRALSDKEVEAKLNNQDQFVIRFKLDEGEQDYEDLVFGKIRKDIGRIESDPVILKSDGMPVYHLANVVDDHFMEVSHVIRGTEWLPSLPKHLLIYKAFGWRPPKFAHVPLLLNQDRLKLSKRSPDFEKYQLQTYVDKGYLPETILNWLVRSGGGFYNEKPWFPGMSMDQMTDAFHVEKLQTAPAELNWPALEVCGLSHFSQLMSHREGRARILATLGARYQMTTEYDDADSKNIFDQVLANRISCFSDFDQFSYIWSQPDPGHVMDKMKAICSAETSSHILQHVANRLKDTSDIESILEGLEVKKYIVMRILRLSLVGLVDGPRISDLVRSLPLKETRARLVAMRSALEKQLLNSKEKSS